MTENLSGSQEERKMRVKGRKGHGVAEKKKKGPKKRSFSSVRKEPGLCSNPPDSLHALLPRGAEDNWTEQGREATFKSRWLSSSSINHKCYMHLPTYRVVGRISKLVYERCLVHRKDVITKMVRFHESRSRISQKVFSNLGILNRLLNYTMYALK